MVFDDTSGNHDPDPAPPIKFLRTRSDRTMKIDRIKEQAEKTQLLLCGRDIGIEAKGHWLELYKLIQEM